MKFLLASTKSLTNCEISSCNLLQRACSGFPIAACPLKVVLKPACDSENLFRKPTMNVHLNKSTNEIKGKPEQKFDAAFGTTFKISVFKEASKNFNMIFL
jgi:hypothetical protein